MIFEKGKGKKVEMEKQPKWFKQAIIYQLHVRSFYDDNNDGIGDFAGLTKKLEYLASLGVTAIWLLPFYPSPLKDEGYDIANYFDIHPSYGTLNDFKHFLKRAHQLGMKVITELVINHTSDQHPWFQRARRASVGTVWRNFYVWSQTQDKYKEARIIFKDFETSNWAWDPIAKAYYWHRFYSHQPDLNFDNPVVQKQIFRALDYWLEMGVDGLRLDAIPYLFEREGTNCENLEPTHQFIKKLRKHIDSKFKDRFLLAEANQWPEDAVAYFGQDDECHMVFHFPVMPRLFMAIQMEDRFPIIDILEQTPHISSECQWVMFLRNHDELTLEMVSEEERDYMYRIYAKDPKARINLGIRRRLAPLLDNDRSKIELMNILLLSLPGTPVLYYGDEIGMGDNYYLGDRNGVRTPMQWSSDRNAGFSLANPQQLFLPTIIDPLYHYEVVNVENQERNPSSLLWWFRRVFLVRKNHLAFGYGNLEFIHSENPKILAFTRTFDEETLLIVANLSHFSQASDLHTQKYKGYIPYELFHQNAFPIIKEEPYTLTFGPYTYFWFILRPSDSLAFSQKKQILLHVGKNWETILTDTLIKQKLEEQILPQFLKNARWFERKTLTIQTAKIIATLSVKGSELCFLEVSYLEIRDEDLYFLPISFASKEQWDKLVVSAPQSFIATLNVNGEEGALYDSFYSEDFPLQILQIFLNRKKEKFRFHSLFSTCTLEARKTLMQKEEITSEVMKGEQSNTSLSFSHKYILKFFRKLEEGIHPEIEILQFFTEKTNFTHIPPFAGSLEWKRANRPSVSLAIMQKYIANQGNGWEYSLDALIRYIENVQTKNVKVEEFADDVLDGWIGAGYLECIRILGERTAEMHAALSTDTIDASFTPEKFSVLDTRSLYQMARYSARTVFRQLMNFTAMQKEHVSIAEIVLGKEQEIIHFYQKILSHTIPLIKMRIHGDFHLGQTLYTGKDFYFIDFEGEPLLSLSSRRIKKCCLQDVAGMLRSFHYAAYKTVLGNPNFTLDIKERLEPWVEVWYKRVSKYYIESYLKYLQEFNAQLIPPLKEDRDYILQFFIIAKAIYELGYDLNMRPSWVNISCKGILYHLDNPL